MGESSLLIPELTDDALEVIEQLGHLRAPIEACGLLLPIPFRGRRVIELPNRSDDAAVSYEFTSADVKIALEEWPEGGNPKYADRVAIWHTHPGGGVGPSRGDMRTRVQGIPYLVVALTREGPVPCWF